MEISRASFAEPWPRNEFIKHSGGLFVAQDGAEIAGFVIGKISDGHGMLKLIAVNPAYRDKGIGKSLMDYIFKYFKENGVREAIARSRFHNEAGCSFLKSFGFKAVETIKDYYRNGEDAYLMVRKLDG